MFLAHTAAGRRWALVAGAVVTTGALLTGCSGGGGSSSSGSASSDTINYALPANFTPNWILPVGTASHLNTNNASISQAVWEPLIAYDGSTGTVGWNKDNSLATDAKFAADSKSVTITLGDRHWSDGKQITSRDVEFWFNLVKANKRTGQATARARRRTTGPPSRRSTTRISRSPSTRRTTRSGCSPTS